MSSPYRASSLFMLLRRNLRNSGRIAGRGWPALRRRSLVSLGIWIVLIKATAGLLGF